MTFLSPLYKERSLMDLDSRVLGLSMHKQCFPLTVVAHEPGISQQQSWRLGTSRP